MKEKHIQLIGVALTGIYFIFVAWIYSAEPKSLTEVPVKAQATLENVTTKAQIIANTYQVDVVKFNEGLKAFRADDFVSARDYFKRADPESRDAETQFYIAYSYYRQGFGKVYNDNELFKQGLEQVNKVTVLDKDYVSTDRELKLATPAQLKNELEEGMRLTASDFNPFKVLRERK